MQKYAKLQIKNLSENKSIELAPTFSIVLVFFMMKEDTEMESYSLGIRYFQRKYSGQEK